MLDRIAPAPLLALLMVLPCLAMAGSPDVTLKGLDGKDHHLGESISASIGLMRPWSESVLGFFGSALLPQKRVPFRAPFLRGNSLPILQGLLDGVDHVLDRGLDVVIRAVRAATLSRHGALAVDGIGDHGIHTGSNTRLPGRLVTQFR